MKKIVLVLLFLLVGCSKNTVVCTSNINNKKQKYNSHSKYQIYAKNNIVTRVVIDEEYKSKDSNIIDYFDDYLQLTYLTLKENYGALVYKGSKSKNKVNYHAEIDYKSTDVKEMVKDNYIDKDYVVNDKVTLSGLIKKYESKGAKCDR